MSNQIITLPDGRQLGYLVIGKGVPVVYFHGTASSRLEVLLLESVLNKFLIVVWFVVVVMLEF